MLIKTQSVDKLKTMTVNQLFDFVWKIYWSQAQFKESRWGYEVSQSFKNYISPHLGNHQIKNMGTKLVREWHRSFQDKPYAANRALEVLSRMFTVAIEEEAATFNPCAGVKAFKEKKRERYASEDEIKKICEILDREYDANPRQVAFIYALMYSGARPLSLVKAKRSELFCTALTDGIWGKLMVDGKTTQATGIKEKIHFPPKVVKMIFCIDAPMNGTLFGIGFPRTFWDKVRKEAGCPDLWARDWRRTFATLGLSNGVNIDTIGELLNHQSTQTTKVYAKLTDTARTNAVQLVSEKLAQIQRHAGTLD